MVWAPDKAELADRVAPLIGEHAAHNDDVQVSHAAIQSGWQQRPGKWGRPDCTELQFGYSALVVIGRRSAPTATEQ